MKNKGLIIGGIAIVALGGFLWVRKKNQMAEESGATASDSKSDSPSADLPVKGSGTPVTTTGSGAPPIPAVNVVAMPLTLKPINNAVDLNGTKLSADIQLVGAGNARLAKVTRAIASLNSVGRSVLNYISDTDSLQRATPEFKKGLDAKVGVGASNDNYAERLVTFLRDNSRNWNVEAIQPFPTATTTTTTSFNGDGMDCETEDFAFNGHTF
jgi:LPXTG-motif cell wall-anchored protein